jgi:hypothetical protein
MKMILKTTICLLFVIVLTGCNPPQQTKMPVNQTQNVCLYDGFEPVRIEILPLTEITRPGKEHKINVFVSLFDTFGCSQKWPAVFRFELYEHITRSAEPTGRRIQLWADVDLTIPEKNNQYWQDFLRTYKFTLDCGLGEKQSYILRITCLLPNGKRLSSQLALKT